MRTLVQAATVALCILAAGTTAVADGVLTVFMQPEMGGQVAVQPLGGGPADVQDLMDVDGDGQEQFPVPDWLASWGVIVYSNGARIMWCNGTVSVLPGERELLAFQSDATELLVRVDMDALADQGITFTEGQVVEVVDGQIAETDAILFKDGISVTDVSQLGDNAFIESLPDYNGPATYVVAARYNRTAVPTASWIALTALAVTLVAAGSFILRRRRQTA